MIHYKEYSAKVEYDDEAKLFHGRVIGIKDIINFEGDTLEEAKEAFKESIEEYLAFSKQQIENFENEGGAVLE